MDKQRRKELQEQYNQIKIYMGVIQIKNNVNGKVFIDAYPNLKNKWQTLRGMLDIGRHQNKGLQSDWKAFGPDAFSFEVLEEKDTGDISDIHWELKQMEKKWLLKLQPYGEKGYNYQKETI